MPADLDSLEVLIAKAAEYEGGRRIVMTDILRQCLHNAAPALIAELRELRIEVTRVIERSYDTEDEIEKLLDANRWRPITEAPKDNTGIEAIDSRTGFVRVVDYYKGYPPNWIPCWVLQGASNECYPLDYFTHYRPIPYLPEAQDAR